MTRIIINVKKYGTFMLSESACLWLHAVKKWPFHALGHNIDTLTQKEIDIQYPNAHFIYALDPKLFYVPHYTCSNLIKRDDPDLLACYDTWLAKSDPTLTQFEDPNLCHLECITIPDNVNWFIIDFRDGIEHVCEQYREWYYNHLTHTTDIEPPESNHYR